MPHVATLAGGDTVIAGYPFFFSCSCGVQGRFITAIEGARFCGIHFSGQNQNDTLQFTDNSGNSLPVNYWDVQDTGGVPEDTGLTQT